MDTPQKRLQVGRHMGKWRGGLKAANAPGCVLMGRCWFLRHILGRHSSFRAKRGLRSGTWHCQSAITKVKYRLSRILVRAGSSLASSPLVALELPLPKEYLRTNAHLLKLALVCRDRPSP